MRTNLLRLLFVFVAFILTPCLNAKELNIYSHRQPFLINPFLELFTNETGIKTNVIYSKKGLAQRLQSEGENFLSSSKRVYAGAHRTNFTGSSLASTDVKFSSLRRDLVF